MTREEVQMEASLYCAWFGTDSRFQADVNPNTPAYFYSTTTQILEQLVSKLLESSGLGQGLGDSGWRFAD